jgi:16S rRNA (adenine1518-N6/adenine1519-N6)-dimethyltransferase
MQAYKPSDIIAFLSTNLKKPKKCLSQNFLIDQNILNKIVDRAQIEEGDTVLEIGPGLGVLTKALLNKQAHVIGVEKDAFFANYLKKIDSPYLTIIQDDFLKINLNDIVKTKNKIKVVANIPYNISSPIIVKLLKSSFLFSSLTILLQKQLAERIIGENEKSNSLCIFTQIYSKPTYAFTVSNNCFYPRPSVQSAVVHFSCKKSLNLINEEIIEFEKLFRLAFQQKRKKIITSLSKKYPRDSIIDALLTMQMNLNIRPEELNYEKFLEFFCLLTGAKRLEKKIFSL